MSPHRMNRPWKGGVEKSQDEKDVNVSEEANNPLRPLGVRPNNVVSKNCAINRTFYEIKW